MPAEKPIFVRNIRAENAGRSVTHIAPPLEDETVLIGPSGLQSLPEYIRRKRIPYIRIAAGDGSTSFIIDEVTHSGMEAPPLILEKTGGSAKTLYTEVVKNGERTTIPDALQDTFSDRDYDAVWYRPPLTTFLESQKTKSGAYLLGGCHLTVGSTANVDWLQAHGVGTKLAYTFGGMGTVPSLLRRNLHPVMVKDPHKQETLAGQKETVLAGFAVTVSKLGTFRFTPTVPHDKVWAMTLEGDPVSTRAKYTLAVLIGGLFPKGPDLIVDHLHLINKYELPSVTLYPDQETQGNNVNFDGELTHVDEPLRFERGPKLLILRKK